MTDGGYAAEMPRKLIVCASARTSSNTLIHGLRAAGLGHPREYFHRNVHRRLCAEWGIRRDRAQMHDYIAQLYARCSVNGVFAAKVMFLQFMEGLTNQDGPDFFRDASVVWLYRTDLRGQAASFAAALQSGAFTDRSPGRAKRRGTPAGPEKLAELVDRFADSNGNWLRFFAYAGIRPMVLTSDEVNRDPVAAVERIADFAGLPCDRTALRKAMADRGKYADSSGDKARFLAELDAELPRHAFDRASYPFYFHRGLRARLSRLFARR
jgi:LPS sulfotransferase NodH